MAHFGTFTFLWNTAGSYAVNMLPAMFLTAVLFGLCVPARRRQLASKGLYSKIGREIALLSLVLFCAGLGALTLTPPGFWGALLAGYPVPWFQGINVNINYVPLASLFSAFQGNRWNLFFLLGNMAMFAPIGFFRPFCGTRQAGARRHASAS